MTRIRVLRVLEYEGDADWVLATLSKNSVKVEHRVGSNVIREAQIGNPQIIYEQPKENKND